jgi:hypothetical protein
MSAAHTFPCANCGAKLEFAVGTTKLTCPNCDAEVGIPVSSEMRGEIPLAEGLAAAVKVETRTLATDGKEIRCDGCGAVAVITGQADRCPFCDAPVVAANTASDPVFVPQSLLPAKVTREEANQQFKAWLASRWFAPNDLRQRAQRRGLDGVYLPFWTYDSDTTSHYTGQRGEHYYETQHYTENGKSKTRQVRKTRWYPASGTVHVNFDDVLACGSKGLPQALVDPLEPWDLQSLVAYDPGFLAGFVAERYSIGVAEGWDIANTKMDARIRSAIRSDIGGDEQRISSVSTSHANSTFKHILLPLWLSSYRYHDRVFRFLVNARTGEISGERPWSTAKIVATVVFVLLILVLLYFGWNHFS